MHAIRQKCRPKHQVLVLKCYPRTTKGAVDVKPNSSELSYLLFYATTRRSKVQKVGDFLERKTASDVWRARIGNVQVTLQILAALIEKAPRDLPLYAPCVLKILSLILRSRDITMVESSIPTFAAFCEHHDAASLSAEQEYLQQYQEIVRTYASFASTRQPATKTPMSAPIAMRWRGVGLETVKSVASSEALASVAGRQLDVIIPILLENLWTDDEEFLDVLEQRAQFEEKIDAEKLPRRRTSTATVRTNETPADSTAAAGTTADADKLAEEDTGVLAIQCLKKIFVVNNRTQIYGATKAIMKFIEDRVTQGEHIVESALSEECKGWATRLFNIIARWTPMQDRFVILVTTMDTLVRSPMQENNLRQQLVLATTVDSLLRSDINLIGLSVMDVLLGLIQHVLRVLQLGGALPHLQQSNGFSDEKRASVASENGIANAVTEVTVVASDLRRNLLARLQLCIGHLATHVYYADQISDMISAILFRLKPTPLSGPSTVSAIESLVTMIDTLSSCDISEDPNTDGFFSFDTAKVKALEAIKAVLLVASHQKNVAGKNLGRSRVPIRVWEGTQWLLRDGDSKVRNAYVDAILTWLDRETTKSDLYVYEEKSKGLTRSSRDDSDANLPKRAASAAPRREKSPKPVKTTFLPLLHLAIYENAIQFVEDENDIVLMHLLLAKLVQSLGVNAARSGIPMIFHLQEDILEAETPLAKIRLGSLCHGYFWALSEQFEFDTSQVGRVIQMEILRRRSKSFWVNRICLPPISLAQIDVPDQAEPQPELPMRELESESLRPFDERYQMVHLISLSYAESMSSPPASPAASPGRVFSQPILTGEVHTLESNRTMPDAVKDQMMSEWSKESVFAKVQETSKTVSLNGSRAGTSKTGHRNFLAVNGNRNSGGTNSGTNSPKDISHIFSDHVHRSRPTSTYGLVSGLGTLNKLRRGSAQSPSPASESSRISVTRVDQLKRVLSGQHNNLPGTKGISHSDASSESMISYDLSASEISFNPHQQSVPSTARSVSFHQSYENSRSRSKSRERIADDLSLKPLSSNPINIENIAQEDSLERPNSVPPVPPLPISLAQEGTAAQDHAAKNKDLALRKGRSLKRSSQREKISPIESNTSWGSEGSAMDLQSLLKGIESGADNKFGDVARPPY